MAVLIAVSAAAAFLAGLCILSVMASRIENAQRYADLVQRTRALRAAHQRIPLPTPRGRRR
ncbi:MAG: hypothetical protein ACO3QC_09390 [Phycisphaerales bacterium]